MNIYEGEIIEVKKDGFLVFVPFLSGVSAVINKMHQKLRLWFPDGRRISPEQHRKVFALLNEISEWNGDDIDVLRYRFYDKFMTTTPELWFDKTFTVRTCSMSEASMFITYLVDFIIEWDIPTRDAKLRELCEDVKRYMYMCALHKKCAVCGKRAELHHVDRIGMGNNRNHVAHIGRRCLPLCREHHREVDHIGDGALCDKYHIEYITIDSRIVEIYKLRSKAS